MMKIQGLTQNHEAALAKLMCELWPESNSEEEQAYLQSIRKSEVDAFFLLMDDEMPQGFVQLKVRNDYVEGAHASPIAYVEGIYVRTEFRRKGWAAKLIQLAESWAKEKGLRQLASDTEISNQTSIHFHKESGFTEANRIVCFIKDLD